MQSADILPNLFRTEFRKITSVLCRQYGFDQLETAEDIASDTFLAAAGTWPFQGLPPNPVAWLYAVAKNKARNHFTREALFNQKIAPTITAHQELEDEPNWSDEGITDSQLQMMFAICDPVIPTEAQVCLALRVLCGFGIDEIATAFLSNKETINKRLYRAKERLRAAKTSLDHPSSQEINERLDTVLLCLYLLFNEGYYSETDNAILRRDLCEEAMVLVRMLIANPPTDTPAVNALYALMCFHASRFDARVSADGELILYNDQDEARWDKQLIVEGAAHLQKASVGNSLSRYHLEAGIAYWHTIKQNTPEKWESILLLYNQLLQLNYSPIAALNRTYAFAKVHGAEKAIAEALKLKLTENPYYFTFLGELYCNIDKTLSRKNFESALELAKTDADKMVIQTKLRKLLEIHI